VTRSVQRLTPVTVGVGVAAAAAAAADVPLKEDVADLQAGPAEDVDTSGKDGSIGIVPTSREEVEAQEAFTGAGVEEGVSTIPGGDGSA
jgi:hypothetical protein